MKTTVMHEIDFSVLYVPGAFTIAAIVFLLWRIIQDRKNKPTQQKNESPLVHTVLPLTNSSLRTTKATCTVCGVRMIRTYPVCCVCSKTPDGQLWLRAKASVDEELDRGATS